jgi:Tfp pilus assembly protein PilV
MKPHLQSHGQRARRAAARGYILFELIIALTIFSIGVLGLAQTLNASMEVANILNLEQNIRRHLRTAVEVLKRKPLTEMVWTEVDTATGVTYNSTVEPVSLTMTRGGTLSDMYNLRVIATYTVGNEAREESVDVYVYKPQQQQRR